VATSPADAADTLIGTILSDRYAIVRKLGQGSFATAYQATDRQTGQTCVVKRLSLRTAGSWKDVDLFERESRVLASLNHPRIPKHRAFFASESGNAYFLVQDYVRGSNLTDILATSKRLMTNQVLHIAEDVAEILAYLHRRTPPIVHRDIKPGNIILGPGQRAYLVDFGAVDDDGADATGGSTVVGSYGYMPFEQFAGQVTPASDVYALGATMIHLLTGRPPADFMDDAHHLDVSRAMRGSDRLQAVLARMVDPDWRQRFQSGSELRAALADLSRPPASGATRRAATVTTVAGLLALTAIGVAAWRRGPVVPRQAVAPAAVAAPLDRNLLAPGGFDPDKGWTLPADANGRGGRYLSLRPGQTAYRDVDISPFQASGLTTALAVSVGVRAQRSSQTKAAIAVWSEPDGVLLGDDTRDVADPTQVIGRTLSLPRSTRTLRVVLYGLSTGRQAPSWSEFPVTYYEPEFVVHEAAKLPAFAHLALGRPLPAAVAPPGNDAAWRQAVAWRRSLATAGMPASRPSAHVVGRRRPEVPPSARPTAAVLPAAVARRPSPGPSPVAAPGYRWYDWSTVNSVGNVARKAEPVRRYEPPVAPARPVATPATFPTPFTIYTRVWIPPAAPQAPLALPSATAPLAAPPPARGASQGFQRP
jgi:hypothetical protein